MNRSLYESALREQLTPLVLSSSHGFEHIDLTLFYALQLHTFYGGDLDVITAAVLLHDLGRSDPSYRGKDSAEQSAERAVTFLATVQFPREKIPAVIEAIKEHDQPAIRPSTLEGRILKDADFLAGFGAHGIVRSAMWTAETNGKMQDFIERLEQKMPARFASLEFEQSRYLGIAEYVFAQLFLERLRHPISLNLPPEKPYVVIEGISGSGKSTQMEMLFHRYLSEGDTPVTLHEPTGWYTQAREELHVKKDDRSTQVLLLLLDRYRNLREEIQSALKAGKPLISDRSYLSTMVYQAGEGWWSAANIAHIHMLLPQPTHIFLLDTTPEEALRRIKARADAMHIPLGEHETLEQLAVHRERYRSLSRFFPHMHVIPTERYEVEAIHEQIWARLHSDALSTR